MDNNYNMDVKSQIDFAARKYGGNLPKSVAKAHATVLAHDAMKGYSPAKGNVKTYLSKRLQKLSRIAYKASTPLNIPESRLMNRSKIRDYIDEYKDTHGSIPSAASISSGTNILASEAKNFIAESAAITNESGFDNIAKSGNSSYLSASDIIHSLPSDLAALGVDIYEKNMSEKDVISKHSIGRTTYFSKKKKIDSFMKSNSGLADIEYR